MPRLDVRAMSLLSAAHLVDDYNQSFIPALLPFLIVERHLSHQTAATLVFAQAVSSSVVQPAIGLLADRRSMPWLIAVGIALAGLGVGGLGWLPSFPLLLVAALVSGIGVATFHPEAARFANYVAGDRKVSGMRWFAVGGNLGFATGPTFATAAIAAWGLRGTLAALGPVLVVALLVALEVRRLRTFVPAHAHRRGVHGRDDWPSFGKLSAIAMIRSMAYFGLVSFVPLYVVEALHGSPAVGDMALTALLVAGVAGTLGGGPAADRLGRKPVVLFSLFATTAATLALLAVGGRFGIPGAVVVLLAIGFVLYTSQASMIVLGQEYLPNRIGLASGMTLGLAVSLGGMSTPVLGWLADRHGIAAPMAAVAGLAFVSALITLALPRDVPQRAPIEEISAA